MQKILNNLAYFNQKWGCSHTFPVHMPPNTQLINKNSQFSRNLHSGVKIKLMNILLIREKMENERKSNK